MPLTDSPTSVTIRSLHGSLVEAVGGDIVGGRIAPGATLVPEEVGATYGVSRTVVRETLRVLESKGLISARPSVGTRVRPVEAWHLLDADVLRWRRENPRGEQLDADIAAFSGRMQELAGDLAGNALYDAVIASLTGAKPQPPAAGDGVQGVYRLADEHAGAAESTAAGAALAQEPANPEAHSWGPAPYALPEAAA